MSKTSKFDIHHLESTNPSSLAGIRQVVTGLAELKRQNKEILCTSMCIGSGMGAAGIFVNEATH
jgi:acetyl-CoA acetyltransferase